MTGRELRFDVAEIRESQGLSVTRELPPSALLREPLPDIKLSGPVTAEIEFSVGGSNLLMQARLAGSWSLACSRCLAEHRTAFEAKAEETYPIDSDTIDLSEDFRQTLLLELPKRSLCREDCRGLCSQCGKNLNEGPCGCTAHKPSPFDVLKKLR